MSHDNPPPEDLQDPRVRAELLCEGILRDLLHEGSAPSEASDPEADASRGRPCGAGAHKDIGLLQSIDDRWPAARLRDEVLRTVRTGVPVEVVGEPPAANRIGRIMTIGPVQAVSISITLP